MLKHIDRVQIAVTDAADAAKGWVKYLGAEFEGTHDYKCLGATAHRYRLANGYVELLQATSQGPVAEALAARGGNHLFAGGATTDDMPGLIKHLDQAGTPYENEDGQLHVDLSLSGIAGLRMTVTEHVDRPPVGAIDFFYEVTLLHEDADAATKRFCEIFGLNPKHFSSITSDKFGYWGTLTLFDPNGLHRFEVITASAPEKTMGRFFAKTGPCLYMAFGESAVMPTIEQAVAADDLAQTIDRPTARPVDQTADQMWLHPATLGGMMLGISRPTMAWSWSGRPDRVEEMTP